MLCRTVKYHKNSYSCEDYIDTCVDIFVRGIAVPV
jgi:hypothetical protein